MSKLFEGGIGILTTPSMTGVDETRAYTAGSGAVVLDNNVTVTDGTTTTPMSAAFIKIQNWQTGDILAVDAGFALARGFEVRFWPPANAGGVGDLSIQDSGSAQGLQEILRTMTFTATGGAGVARTITYQVRDDDTSNLSPIYNMTLTVNAGGGAAQAPVLNNLNMTAAYTIGQAAALLDTDQNLTITDADSANLAGFDVRVTNVQAGDQLSIDQTLATQLGITVFISEDAILLDGERSLASYAQLLNTVRFVATGGAGTARTIEWIATDSGSSTQTFTSTVTVSGTTPTPTPPAARPAVTGFTALPAYTEGGDPVAIAPDIAITHNTTISEAQIHFLNFRPGADQVTYTLQGGVTARFHRDPDDSVVLFLEGAASAADYQAILRSVRFSSTYDFTANENRDLLLLVYGSGGVDQETRTDVLVSGVVNKVDNAVGQTPTLDGLNAAAAFVLNSDAVSLDNALTLTDTDSTHFSRASIQVTAGQTTGDNINVDANLARTYGLQVTDYGGYVLVWGRATLAQYKAVLETATFSATAGSGVARTISYDLQDEKGNAATTRQMTMTVANAPPATAPTLGGLGTPRFHEGDDYSAILPGITFAGDVTKIEILFSRVIDGEDDVSIDTTNLTRADYEPVAGGGGKIILEGNLTAQEWQSLLRDMTYRSTTALNANETRTITVKAYNGTLSSESTVNFVLDNNDAPTFARIEAGSRYVGQPATLLADIGIADVDDTAFNEAQVAIQNYAAQRGRLAVRAGTDLGGLTVTFDADTGVLKILAPAGQAAVPALFERVLEAVTFEPTQAVTDAHTRNFTVRIFDGVDWSNAAAVTTEVQPFRPRLADVAAQVNAAAGQTTITLDSSLSMPGLAGGDNLSRAVLWVTGPNGAIAANVQLNAAQAVAGVTEAYDAAMGRLTLSGAATAAQYQTLLQSVALELQAGASAGEYRINWLLIGADGAAGDIANTRLLVPTAIPAGFDVSTNSLSDWF